MSPTDPIDLLAVRSLLDELLLRLPSAEPTLPRTAAADGVSRALAHVYGALAARADLDRFRDETRAALGDAQRALASIEPHGATSPSAAELVTLMTQAIQAISDVRYRPLPDTLALPRAGESKPWLRASVGEPALLDFTRPLIVPTVPLAAEEPKDPLAVPDIDFGEDAPSEPIPELEEALALALSKTGAPDSDEDGEDEDEPPETELESEDDEEDGEGVEPVEPEAALALVEPPPEPRPPAADEELEGHYFGEAVPASEILAQQARLCLEEIGNLGLMRRPEPDQGWMGRAEAERRLLARVDAIAACGAGVFPRLVRSLDDRPIPDPELTWALLFFFGSLAGDDAHDQLLRIARLAPLDSDPAMVDAVADALALAPHPAVTSDLRAWLSDPAPERRMVALTTLARRGALETPQALPFAADPDPLVAEAAAVALASSKGPMDSRVLGALLRHSEERVVAAAMETAVLRRQDQGAATARALVVEGRADFAGAAEVLGVTGNPQAFEPLVKAAEAGSPAACAGLGWLGSLQAVDLLIGQLEGPNKPVALAALQRLTAASLTADAPAPEYDEDELPFRPAEPAVPEPDELLADPAAWRAWWSQHRQRAKPDARHRFGGLWSVWSSLAELEAPFSVRRNRRLAHLELCACFPVGAPLDLESFVARQKTQLAAWRPLLQQAARRSAGSWTKSRTALR